MSNCISLISCDGQCPDIHNIQGTSRTNLLPYVDELVRINNNIDCTYFVRNTILLGFTIDSTDFLCNLSPQNNLSTYSSVTYRINSISYDGVELITTPNGPQYTITNGNFDCLYCDVDSTFCVDATTQTPNNSNAHSQNLNTIFSNLGLNIQVFPYGQDGGVVFRIFDIDRFSIEIERLSNPNAGVYNMAYNSKGFSVAFNNSVFLSQTIFDDTTTCTPSRPLVDITSVTGVTDCGIRNTYENYITVNECDVITIHPMGVSCNIVNIFNKSGSTRSATLVVTGGTPPYSFIWENGNTTSTIINLPAGEYNATVSDAFSDYIIETSCFLPPIDCSKITIRPNMTFSCNVTGGNLQTGTAILSIIPTGGDAQYTITGNINGTITAITNNMIVNHLDFITILVTDTNGCESLPTAIGIICPPGTPPTPTPNPNDSNLPQPCIGLINCPLNTNTFLLSLTATTENFGTPLEPQYIYYFNLRLTSPSNYTGTIVGSYKIYDVDLPNSFLPTITTTSIPNGVVNEKYWAGATGTPDVQLNDYIEFGFTELTPTNPTNSDSPWNFTYLPFGEINFGYTPTYTWVPSVSTIQISVALFDDEYCVHKGTSSIVIPSAGSSNTQTISF